MSFKFLAPAALTCLSVVFTTPQSLPVHAIGLKIVETGDGVITVKSRYPMTETVDRIKADIANKGIVFFLTIDQSKLAQDAGIALKPSTLLIFGNPALGSNFITAKAEAGLDWPVRLLIHQDAKGQVWANYTDFAWLAHRHGITNRDKEFAKTTEVIKSITSTIALQ